MAQWSDAFRGYLHRLFGSPLDPERVVSVTDWVSQRHAEASACLDPEALKTMAPDEVYRNLERLRLPKCQIRVTNLGRMNEAAGVVEALVTLMSTQGDFEQKYRAAKCPQAGVVTMTELLCLARPTRFLCRNTACTNALATVIPFYSRKAIRELPYREFMDLCRELVRVLEEELPPVVSLDWIRTHRYLLLYAVLVTEPTA